MYKLFFIGIFYFVCLKSLSDIDLFKYYVNDLNL